LESGPQLSSLEGTKQHEKKINAERKGSARRKEGKREGSSVGFSNREGSQEKKRLEKHRREKTGQINTVPLIKKKKEK